MEPHGRPAGPRHAVRSRVRRSGGLRLLTATYERLRHSTDPAELSEFARRPLPDRADQAAFSRATATFGGCGRQPAHPGGRSCVPRRHHAVPERIGQNSPKTRIVRASSRGRQRGRQEIGLVGRLTKDPVPAVRDTALKNKRTSWKMRLEGAQDPNCGCGDIRFWAYLALNPKRDTGACFLRWSAVLCGTEPQYVRSDACQIGQRPLGRGAARRGKLPLSTYCCVLPRKIGGQSPPVHHCERSHLTM